ncbi:MAG TPA: membrane protein insertase YidC [Vicinamibacterales bacterium]|nr:membrane protein insertase YidC [Vicinamibacterales bacterium]
MEKRVLLAVVLSFVVLYGYQAIFPPPKPVPAATQVQQPAAAGQQAQPGNPPIEAATPTSVGAAPAQPAAAPLVADAAERDIVMENESVRAIFTTRGGALKSWRLKKYQDGAREPLELIPQNPPAGQPRPFTLAVDDPGVSATLGQALFRPSATALDVSSGPATLTFEYADGSGLAARKDFSFDPRSPYVVHVSASVNQGTTPLVPTVQWGPALGNAVDMDSRGSSEVASRPILYRDGDVNRVDASDIAEVASQEGAFGFAGVDDHYFLTAIVLPKQVPVRLTYETVAVPPAPGAEDAPPPYIRWAVRFNGAPSGAAFFAGPKDFDVLAAIDRELVKAIDFGMFAWLVVPLLRALKWLNVYVGNYGWSIVWLTVLINLAMFPLRHKSVVSMRRMQEIQPEMKSIQDRYAKLKMTDPGKSKMNEEMMALYKSRGVNPASGCVPMLLTMPVLFAFYAMLSVAIELRGAPFIWWITDLSRHDPLYITPILMGLTQFVQTKMTPSTADPTQQRIMLLMPLIFMFMFVKAPSGLVLYWTISNAWAIGQQYFTNKLIGPSQPRTVRPAAERKVKNAGAGRTEQASKERK